MQRWNITAACVFAAACAESAVGADFHTKYAGGCASSAAEFGSDVEHSGERWGAARDRLVSEIAPRSDALRRCYIEALANVERLQGRVVLRITLAPRGGLDKIVVAENATGYEPLACCVAAVVSEIAWPPSAAGAGIGLEYPFTFSLIRMPYGYRDGLGADFAFNEVLPSGYKLVLDGAMYGGGPVR
ncbi:MAG TPA: AgmX/PglI C-terminal domain-containing protein [Polyangiales bacterium]|nr:AgmX/PglI C-terminal domain-containing protein [Polyangiales bacterium]